MIARRLRTVRPSDVVALLAATLVGLVVTAQMGDAPPTPVSKFVYPKQPSIVRFDHGKHRDVACTSCHGAALTSQRASDDLRPPMKACAGCHTTQAPKLRDCAGCHVGYSVRAGSEISTEEEWNAVRPAPMIPPRSKPSLRFDHSKHVGRLGGERACAQCHGGGEPSMPSMASCTSCHDQDPSAPSDCATCHPADDSTGKLRTTNSLTDEPLRPDNHGVDFAKRHAILAKSSSDDCMACHREEDCATCHTESLARPFAVHPPNFLTMHAVDARTGSGECTDCHTVQTFCTSCHMRADVTTAAPNDPPARRRIHPDGWLQADMPNNHGVMARRDITECASCHSETDCVTCHAGINPHPPDFALDCGRMLAANSTPCARCHSDMPALRTLCR